MATSNIAKTSFFGLLSAVLMSAPAFAQNAATVVQTSEQTATQVGSGNVSVQGNVQTADVTQFGSLYGFPYGGGVNGAQVMQGNSQNATQIGHGNTSVQANSANATVLQGAPTYPYPWFGYPNPSINGAQVGQGNHQSAVQAGEFNQSIQGNVTDATVTQH